MKHLLQYFPNLAEDYQCALGQLAAQFDPIDEVQDAAVDATETGSASYVADGAFPGSHLELESYAAFEVEVDTIDCSAHSFGQLDDKDLNASLKAKSTALNQNSQNCFRAFASEHADAAEGDDSWVVGAVETGV